VKTKYEEGFTDLEIIELCKSLNVDPIKVNKQLYGNTCRVIDGEIISYKWDVDLAIRCVQENREPYLEEWD
jgi:hypothetical protein